MITKFVLNSILNHVGMSWILFSKEEMFYVINKINPPGWLNKGPWYNTDICSNLHGKLFEYFITHAKTDIYNLMCYVVAHDKKQPSYEDEEAVLDIGQYLKTKQQKHQKHWVLP